MNFSIPEFSTILSWMETLIKGIGFADVIDIVIVSFIVYKVIGYVRGTRAAQLAKGIIFLFIVAALAETFNIYAVSWILKTIIDAGLIALIVIFQPELRRALERIGRGGRFNSNSMTLSRELAEENVDQIVRAVQYFAARKEGALIIIERNTALNEIAETGTIVDAKLSELALENIFYKGSPLHDGACIIRGDRILAAGCVLPLTENQNLSKDLGTRHRAGIGMSEVSDALILIVSEETGIISMAMGGKLSRFLDLKAVEKLLLTYYMSKVKTEDGFSFKEMFRRRDDEITEVIGSEEEHQDH